ncbi:MAG: hypothetical protein ABIS86_07285 [Streptosporangiaceae bacterium]
MSVRLVRLSAVTLLVVVAGGPGLPERAQAAESGVSPSTGSLITAETVTVSAHAPAEGGKLRVDGVVRASGEDELLTYTIDGSEVRNGAHSVEFEAGGPSRKELSNFWMAAPAAAPAGVDADVSGTTVTVRWAEGSEPDLTGYTLSSRFGSHHVGPGDTSGSFQVPAAATGTLTVAVVAERAGGAADSESSTGTVELRAPVVVPAETPEPAAGPTPTSTHTSAVPPESAPAAPPPAGAPGIGAVPVTTAKPVVTPSPSAPAPASLSIPHTRRPSSSPTPALARKLQATEVGAVSADSPRTPFGDPLTGPALAAGLASLLGLTHTALWSRRRRLADGTRLRLLLAPRSGSHAKPRRGVRLWD